MSKGHFKILSPYGITVNYIIGSTKIDTSGARLSHHLTPLSHLIHTSWKYRPKDRYPETTSTGGTSPKINSLNKKHLDLKVGRT